ncbi:hypothetical protein Hamer_G005669 [Homarus americanus]|uniref:C2 domain-containing protein n=1 Tax=Homarus americanus TaxID=6706 RepID=A0A8J5JZK3_HOMAM|nr:hypothetical protein Hamer_G005669 [Homarus americanus]
MKGKMTIVSAKVKGKMSDINTKMKNKGYNPFGTDDSKGDWGKRKTGGSSVSSSSSGEDGQGRGVVAFLRGICCCCFYPHPQHPLLSSSVVTHRKISRVESTESLAKDNLELPERPTHALMTPQERLLHARALNRLQSNNTTTTQAHAAQNGVTKSGRSTNQPVAAPRSGRIPVSASNSPSNPPDKVSSISSQLANSSCPSLANASPKSLRRLPVTPSGSPRPERSSHAPRPTQLSLAIHAARNKGSTTPTTGSPASTPTTPRSGSGSWGVVRTGFNSLMKAVTTSPHHRHDPHNGLPHSDEEEEVACNREDKGLPKAACIRPATGGLDNPAKECYGSVTLKVVGRQGRWVRVGVCGLAGLPWVGGSGGLMLEVSVEPGGRSRWMVLPHAHGPNVNVKLEAVVKAPRESKTKKRGLVKVSVWVCERVWRHGAIGHALAPLTEPSDPVTVSLHHHTQVSLRCDYHDTSTEGVGNSAQGEVTLTLEVLRARNLRPHHPSVFSKAAHSRKKDIVEVVCRVGLWVKGERIERESSTPVRLPVTQDPVFRSRSVFILHRENLQHAAILLKVLYTSKWGVEDTVGRLQLGHLLYLGSSPDHTYLTPPPDYNTSITLSHWGQALKTPGPNTMWHHLQL